MTSEKRDKLNRFLAEKVMGWTITRYYCFPPGLPSEANVAHYKLPDFGKWADCEPLLDKIEQDGWAWKLGTSLYVLDGGGYWCQLAKGQLVRYRQAHIRTEALCLAIARAYGYQEEGA